MRKKLAQNISYIFSNSRYLLYLKTGGVGGKVFSQTVERQVCLSPSAWMESRVCEKSLPPTPCQIKKNRPVISSYSFFLCLLFSNFSDASCTHHKQCEADRVINKIYQILNNSAITQLSAKLNIISASFLGKQYLLGALGEGLKARFDQGPQYRIDAFDCETYVTTVLALALANDLSSFKNCLTKIRYFNNKRSYINRNHFTELDWNNNNQRQGFIKDLTNDFTSATNQPLAKIASTMIDKPSWYRKRTINDLCLPNLAAAEKIRRLNELKRLGNKLPKCRSNLPYIPLTALFNAQGKPNKFVFAQIPDAAIIEIVRPNWQLIDKIGTNLNVSHMGFAFWKKNILFFREASSIYHKIVDIALIDYLLPLRNSPTIKGINIQVVSTHHKI